MWLQFGANKHGTSVAKLEAGLPSGAFASGAGGPSKDRWREKQPVMSLEPVTLEPAPKMLQCGHDWRKQ
jgi:hypothetical protein